MDFNKKQLEAINHFEGNCCVLASAGSGKTSVLVQRIKNLINNHNIKHQNILAITFSRKAAQNMNIKLGDGFESVNIDTFHAMGYKMLKEQGFLNYNTQIIKDWEKKQHIIDICTKILEISSMEETVDVNGILSFIALQKNQLLTPKDDLIKQKKMAYSYEIMKQIYQMYEQLKSKKHQIDFDDMILMTYYMLENNHKIREIYQSRFQFILVDEMQDTNKAQYEIIRLLGKTNNNVFVVGDPLQCFIPTTPISTPQGKTAISEIKSGDIITVAQGRGEKINAKVSSVLHKQYDGKIIKIKTKNGNVIEGTPGHCIFTKQMPKENLHYVYLMFKNKVGYRIGITSSCRAGSDKKKINGYEGRLTQETGDAIWILEVCDSLEDAMYFEEYYSYYYGIPQSGFISRSNKGLQQQDINKLFKNIDTLERVTKLMKDKLLFKDIPYHIASGGGGRNRINFTMFENSKVSKIKYFADKSKNNVAFIHSHGIAIDTSNPKFKDCAEKYLKFNNKKNTSGYDYMRASKSSYDYDFLFELSDTIAKDCNNESLDVQINYNAKITDILYKFTPMSYARKGMTIPIESGDNIIDDEIISVETYEYSGLVYDLNVDYYRNYIANGVVVHNCIYEWRGCDNNYIINFHKDWIDTKVINLNINYRSTSNIVRMANKLVEGTKETTHAFYVKSKANKPKYKDPEFVRYECENTEAESIAEKISKLVSEKNYNYKDVSVLTRTNFQMQAIETAFFECKIPYEMIDGNTFYEQREIQDMIAYLKLIKDSNDDTAFQRIFNTPNRYLGKVFLEEVNTYAKSKKTSLYQSMLKFPRTNEWRYAKGIDEIHRIVNKVSKRKRYNVGELINIIRNDLDYDSYISKEISETNDKNEKIENLDTLVIAASKHTSITDFLSEVENILSFSKETKDENKVKIMTIHKSKGLEFPVVFIPSVNDGILPHFRSDNENEERRLLYVAITRAERELFISSTMTYNNKVTADSLFIDDIF